MQKLFFFFIVFSLAVGCHTHTHEALPLLSAPDSVFEKLYPDNEFAQLKQRFEENQKKIQKNDKDYKAWTAILDVYLLQSRVTQDHKFAEMMVNVCDHITKNIKLRKDEEFQTLSYKATALLSLHRFKDGLEVAGKASEIIPHNAAILGAMIDANVELGHYQEAVKLADKMVSLRPDLRSYSRISYLRELNGDLKGAADAMDMAVKSGVPGDEQCEWARVNLGNLYLKMNQPLFAKMHYTIAADNRKGYLPALIGMAKLHLAEQNTKEAAIIIEKAEKIRVTPDLLSVKAEMYKISGDVASEEKTYTSLMHMITDHHHDDANAHHHHHTDKSQYALEAAKYIVKHDKDIAEALPYLKIEEKNRPENIEVNALLTMVYTKMGDAQKAEFYAQKSKMKL